MGPDQLQLATRGRRQLDGHSSIVAVARVGENFYLARLVDDLVAIPILLEMEAFQLLVLDHDRARSLCDLIILPRREEQGFDAATLVRREIERLSFAQADVLCIHGVVD